MASTTPAIWKSLGRVNTTDVTLDGNGQYHPTVVGLRGGGFVVAWEDDTSALSGFEPNDVGGQIYGVLGDQVGTEFLVSWNYLDLSQQAVSLTATSDGGFLGAFQSQDAAMANDGENIDVSVFDPTGSYQRNDDYRQGFGQVTPIDDTAPSISAFSGGYILAYETNTAGHKDIVYHITTAPFAFPTPPPPRVTADDSAGNQVDPQLAILVDDPLNPTFAIVFRDEPTGSIKAYVSDGDGPSTTVTLSSGSQNTGPAVAALKGGGFVAVWQDGNGDGAGNAGIAFRLATVAGTPIGLAPGSANATKAGIQSEPTVAALADGGFAIAWNDDAADVIRVQSFASDGTKAGVEFAISAPVGATIHEPALSLLGDGRLALTYTASAAGNDDVYAVILDARLGPVDGTAGNDTLTAPLPGGTVNGLAGDDALYGGDGNDSLNGGINADTMQGNAGNDTYYVDNAGDTVVEAAGKGALDWVASSISYVLGAGVEVEKLSTTSSGATTAINLTGNEFAQAITGNAGANKLDGKGGADTMTGLGGNDTYYVDNAGDKVVEGAGQGTADWVATSVSYTLGAGVQVEKLSTTSSGATTAIDLTGNEFVQAITGNAGANRLNGMGGADTMTGLGGNDTYYIDNAGDKVVEGAGQGTADWVAASISYTLAGGVQAEKLSTTSNGLTTAIDLTGNEFAQAITGNAGANRLNGMGGADTMTGLGGNDTYYIDNAGDKVVEGAAQGTLDWVATSVTYGLGTGVHVEFLSTTSSGGTTAINISGNEFGQTIVGNAGANLLTGKAGNDTLTGAAGADMFFFDTALNDTTNVDTITDFNVAADTIRLENGVFTQIVGTGTLTSAQFVKNTTGLAQDASDHVIYETDTGKLFYDSNGSAAGGSIQFATLAVGLALTNADFAVV